MFAASKTASAAAAGATTDPYFPYVPLLLNTTSTNAQQNNTFLDSSTNNFTITRNGTPTQGAFTPYQPSGYWSGYFASSYLNSGTTAINFLCTGSSTGIVATFEAWVYPTAYNTGAGTETFASIYCKGATYLNFGVRNGAVRFYWYDGATKYVDSTSTSDVPLNTWTHIAITISGSTIKIYVNGTLNTTSATYTGVAVGGLNQNEYIGIEAGGSTYFSGYISNLRLVNGVAVYTGNFTVPTTPLASTQSAGTNISAITGTATKLLTVQSNRFIDNSTNAFAITVNGTPKVQAFQPFSPAASYSAATYGGSGYFGGTSNYLSTPDATAFNLSGGSWTIECWIYPNGTYTDFNNIVLKRGASTAWQLYLNQTTGYLSFFNLASAYNSTSTPIANAWNHIAAVYDGTNINLYLNGTRVLQSATTNLDFSATVYVGAFATQYQYLGYISNVRIVKGTAIYSGATYTVPTSPVTAVSGTSLLTNFTNAGIYDAAWQNNALTVGDAQTSISQYKWSPTSMRFDGTGDYLTMPLSAGTTITSGNFTVEFWLYPSTVATATQAIIGTAEGDTAGTINWMAYLVSSSLYFQCYSNSSTLMVQFNHQTSLSAGNWYYCAVTRSGSTFTLYLNGVASTSTPTSSATINQSGSTLYVGKFGASSSIGALNGYIQDLRITKGVARTITTPTAAFPTR